MTNQLDCCYMIVRDILDRAPPLMYLPHGFIEAQMEGTAINCHPHAMIHAFLVACWGTELTSFSFPRIPSRLPKASGLWLVSSLCRLWALRQAPILLKYCVTRCSPVLFIFSSLPCFSKHPFIIHFSGSTALQPHCTDLLLFSTGINQDYQYHVGRLLLVCQAQSIGVNYFINFTPFVISEQLVSV